MEQNIETAEKPLANAAYQMVPTKNKIIGLLALHGPILFLIIVMLSWAIISSLFSLSANDVPAVKWILGLCGILGIVAIIPGIIFGIIYLLKKEDIDVSGYDKRSGEGQLSEIPEEIKGLNLGAALLPMIWGLYHDVWIVLLTFVPFGNIVLFIILLLNGNEQAWRARKWESPEKFIASQKKWRNWGILFLVLSAVLTIAFIMLVAYLVSSMPDLNATDSNIDINY